MVNLPVNLPSNDALDESKICVVNGFCCCLVGLLCDPSCIGCMGKSECLCLTHEVCLKANTKPLLCDTPPGDICQVGLGLCSVGLKKPTTCCKGQEQLCCVVEMAAFPTDNDVPATCALYGLMCFPKVGCCVKLGDLKKAKIAQGGAPEAPDGAPEAPAIAAVEMAEAISR
ncbi:hypothetical protein M885DRAFT_518740 [Pelagophyceae sp. CCMP2097]|nr:hypothetical protein M885DRAFT_518740 [Pelagophyceae sp. CCMP2097]|mmetsp:Transcript_15481/g.52212  ORF Transcript_15481/g.52212 Transcript_15481/m.52212 type:complete len:171 (+) Transcript_15481:168-680(+)